MTWSDPSFTEAWAEAAASGRRHALELVTIELIHPGIIDEDENLVPIRAVSARKPKMLRLDADAVVDAGELVEFNPIPFKASMPSRGDNVQPKARITIDNIGNEVWKYVEAAVATRADALLTIRKYFANDPDTIQYGPITMVVTDVSIANGAVEGSVSLDTQSDVSVPTLKYSTDVFRNLQQ